MPDTADHRADMYALGQQRLKAGKPMWESKISVADVFHSDAMTFTEIRDAVVRRLRASAWFKSKDEYDDLSIMSMSWPRLGPPATSTVRGTRSTTRPTPTACGSPPADARQTRPR